ncbi:hypothetical protein Pfra02_27620 [Pseudomonas fragi]|nr:hypothetical protein Pfra02_27620 [Pseudomonas fragi]
MAWATSAFKDKAGSIQPDPQPGLFPVAARSVLREAAPLGQLLQEGRVSVAGGFGEQLNDHHAQHDQTHAQDGGYIEFLAVDE